MSSSLDDLNSDLILAIASHFNVQDAAQFMATSKRYYYLTHQLRAVLGPEMVVGRGSGSQPVQSALHQLRQTPTLALCCSTDRSTFNEVVATQFPSSTIILGAQSQSIQTCMEGHVESSSQANVLLGHLGKDAALQPFCWQPPSTAARNRQEMEWDDELEQQVKDTFRDGPYEVLFLFACGQGCEILEDLIERVQNLHPNAALVGGICSSGYVSRPVTTQEVDRGVLSSKRVAVLKQMFKSLGGSAEFLKTLTEKQLLVDEVFKLLRDRKYVLEPHIENGVFGVALGGNVPIQSVVSRGVKRLTPPDSVLLVQEARLVAPVLRHNWQQGGNNAAPQVVQPGFHVLEEIHDKDDAANTKTWNVMSFLAHSNQSGEGADFCGVRRLQANGKYEETFELYALDLHGDKIKIPVTNSDLFTNRSLRLADMASSANNNAQGQPQQQSTPSTETTELDQAQIDFFALDGPSCTKHVETTMQQLKQHVSNRQQQVLAAFMVSCAGRGPHAGWLMSERMADATAFHRAFPSTPMIGFYAGGEIGPLATAPVPDVVPQNPFQRGKAALQGFTAVFALFIAPKVDLRHLDIDDSPQHVQEFISQRLKAD